MTSVIKHCVLALTALLFIACNKQYNEDGKLDISVQQSHVEVSDDGGTYTIEYHISNPLAGITLLTQCETEWITDITLDGDHTLHFRALANPSSESREGVITLRYPSLDDINITVLQAASTGVKIAMELIETDYSSCSVSLTPHNKDMHYIVMMAEKSYFAAMGITDEQTLVEADISYFQSYMGEAEVTFEQFIIESKVSLMGDNIKSWSALSPAKEYIIYTYGIELGDEEYTRLTPVYHLNLGKRMPQRSDVLFDIEVVTEGPEVSFDITPREWDGYYMVQLVADNEAGYIAQGSPLTEEFAEAVAESFFYVSDNLYYYYEYTIEEIFEQLGYIGHAQFHKTLNANHKYMAIVYAIASVDGNIPMVVSNPVVKYFSTGDVVMSDITFNIEVDNIKPRSADISITPSNSNESYTAVLMYASNLPDGTPAEQLEYVLNRYSIFEIRGKYSECVEGLRPNTEFVLAVFGVYAGAATTDLVTYRFTTTEEREGSNRITAIKYRGYDLHKVVALDNYYDSMLGYGDYLLSVDIETLEPTERVYFDIFSVASYEENGLKWIRESLLDYSYHTLFDWALCSYGNSYVVCGYAEDADGNIGEIFVSDYITLNSDDMGDASEFVERYKEYTE